MGDELTINGDSDTGFIGSELRHDAGSFNSLTASHDVGDEL